MIDEELIEKCRLTPEEFADLQIKYLKRQGRGLNIWGNFPLRGEEHHELLKVEQLIKAIPIIRDEMINDLEKCLAPHYNGETQTGDWFLADEVLQNFKNKY